MAQDQKYRAPNEEQIHYSVVIYLATISPGQRAQNNCNI